MIPGFFHLLWTNKRDVFLQPDFVALTALAGLVGLFVPSATLVANFEPFATAAVGVSAGLLGLVLALLAVVMSFLPDDLLLYLKARPGGLEGHAFPFSFSAMLAVAATISAAGSLLLIPRDDVVWMRLSAGVTWFFFTWTLTTFLELLKMVFDYWGLKALYLERDDD